MTNHNPFRVRTRRALTVAGATGAALAVWALAGPIGGVPIAVHSGETVQPVGVALVAATSMLAGLAGWALLAGYDRVLRRPHRAWTVTAIVVYLLSLLGPLGGADTAARLALAAMHTAVAAVLIAGLPRAGRPHPRAGRAIPSQPTATERASRRSVKG